MSPTNHPSRSDDQLSGRRRALLRRPVIRVHPCFSVAFSVFFRVLPWRFFSVFFRVHPWPFIRVHRCSSVASFIRVLPWPGTGRPYVRLSSGQFSQEVRGATCRRALHPAALAPTSSHGGGGRAFTRTRCRGDHDDGGRG